MMFTLKRAKSPDALAQVALLDYLLFTGAGSPGLTHDELHKDVAWWLAYAEGETHPVGFCGMHLDESWTTSFIRAGVLEQWRRLGLQKLMIRKRVAYAKRLGYELVQTYVWGGNVASTKALLSCGFVPHKASQSKRDGLWIYVEAKT